MNKNQRKSNTKRNVKREQPRKDGKSKRINCDNDRVSKAERNFKNIEETGASNDVRWYANNPELLRAAASLPFSQTTGLPLPWDGAAVDMTVPGVMSLRWRPSIGGAFIDPINQAANSTYSFVVHANSRNKSYDAPDLMQLILCGASLFSMIAHGIRAYGIMRTYDQTNAYLPKALIHAMGFDFDDLKQNLSNMWFDLNQFIAQTQQIWIPKNFPFIERWFWLNSNIYMDAASIKGQYYIFTPSHYLVYSSTGDYASDDHIATASLKSWSYGVYDKQNPYDAYTNISATVLDPPNLTYYLHTWKDYMNVLENMISPLLQSQDRGIIFGDILKAYGADNIYSLQPITSDYRLVPVYDREVLTQIENCTVSSSTIESFAQDPTTNRIYESAYTSAVGQVSYDGVPTPNVQVLNFHQVEAPSPEQIMVATRLKAFGMVGIPNEKGDSRPGGKYAGGWAPAACGTEVVTAIAVSNILTSPSTASRTSKNNGNVEATYSYTAPVGSVRIQNLLTMVIGTTTSSESTLTWHDLQNYVSFDWAPWRYKIVWTAPWGSSPTTKLTYNAIESNQPDVAFTIGDYDYYTIIDTETAKKLHRTAIYSEFGVPTI